LPVNCTAVGKMRLSAEECYRIRLHLGLQAGGNPNLKSAIAVT
jgi:hypothetical protein